MAELKQPHDALCQPRGEAKGKTKGCIETLQKQLTLKFREPPESVSLRLISATDAELERWIELVLSAQTLEAVMGG